MAEWNPRANEIFATAADLPTEQRQAYLEQACGADPGLRREVDDLLAAHEQAGNFLDRPAAGARLPDAGLVPTTPPDSGPPLPAGAGVVVALGCDLPPVRLRELDGEMHSPANLQADAEKDAGNLPGRYRMEGEIARGGMGCVLRGRDTELGREVAVKVLLETHQGRTELVQRFVEEAQIAGQLQHPGITPVYDVGSLAGKRPYFTMKLVKGKTLSKLLAQRSDPAQERVRFLKVFEQVCQTLAYAHARGVIHRDLKPANIMVGAFGEVQVMDWGLAKVLASGWRESTAEQHEPTSVIATVRSKGCDADSGQTQAGTALGTPAYMAPEQARGELARVDERADVFGLGALLCEILTGKPPFPGKSAEAMRLAQNADLAGALLRLDGCGADVELAALARRCLAAEPDGRPRHAGEVAEGVAAYLESVERRLRQAEMERAQAEVKANEERKRRRGLLIAASMVLLALLAGMGGMTWGLVQTEQARQTAEIAEANERQQREEAEEQRSRAERSAKDARQQRDEAQRQRTRAEEGFQLARGAVERYLAKVGSSLRLEEYGLHTLRKELLSDAEAFYEQLIKLRANDPTLKAELAEALSSFARIARINGSTEKAIKRLERAVAIFDELARADPGNETYQWNFVTKAADLAELHAYDGLLQRGEDLCKQALTIQQPLAAAKPQDESSQAALASIYTAYASVSARAKRREQSVEFEVKCHEIYARLASAHAEDNSPGSFKNAQGASLINLGLAYAHLRRFKEAEKALDRSLAIFREILAAHPNNTWMRSGVGKCLINLGSVYLSTNRISDAEAVFQEALAIYQKNTRDDPEITRWQASLAMTWEQLAKVYQSRKQTARVAEANENICKVWEKLCDTYPEEASFRTNLGVARSRQGKLDEAIVAFREAIERDGKSAKAHRELGRALYKQSMADKAIASFREAIKFDPKDAHAHFGLGRALQAKGEVAEAIACFREAIEHDRDDELVQAHAALAMGLLQQGELAEAEACLLRSLDLLPPGHSGRPALTEQLQQCQHWLALEKKLPDILARKIQPADTDEQIDFASVCAMTKRYRAAAQLYAQILTPAPKGADDPRTSLRYNAACSAALAAAGKGRDAGNSEENEPLRWRRLALTWLRADLALLDNLLQGATPAEQATAFQTLQHWQEDADLAGLRDKDALGKLPMEERQACEKLWADVQTLLKKSEPKPK